VPLILSSIFFSRISEAPKVESTEEMHYFRHIKAALGEAAKKVAVSSTKSMHGHLLGAAGAVEAAASILALTRGLIPPTINYETPDPECDLDYVPNQAREATVKVAMSNSFGFGGHNATVLLRKYV